jgi:hypothetical protein
LAEWLQPAGISVAFSILEVLEDGGKEALQQKDEVWHLSWLFVLFVCKRWRVAATNWWNDRDVAGN